MYFDSAEFGLVVVFGVIERKAEMVGESLVFCRGGASFGELDVKSQKWVPEGVDGCDAEKNNDRFETPLLGDEGGEGGESNGGVIESVDEEELLELA